MCLVGAPESEEADADLAAAGGGTGGAEGERSPQAGKAPSTAPVTIVLLLPDGRWQELNLQKLELRVPTAAELGTWSTHLIAASQGRVARPPALKPSSRPSPRTGSGGDSDHGTSLQTAV